MTTLSQDQFHNLVGCQPGCGCIGPVPDEAVGDIFGGAPGHTWVEVEELDAKVSHVSTDANAWAQSHPEFAPSWTAWQGFAIEWKAWFAQTKADLPPTVLVMSPAIIGGDRSTQFEGFKRRYNEHLRQLTDKGLVTSATSAGSWFEKIPWKLVLIVGAVVLLPFYISSFTGLALATKR